jgi:type III secretion protein R
MAQPLRDSDPLARPIALVVAVSLVGLLPFAFMMLTSFVKISTVLEIARSAIGANSIPSNVVVLALAGALSMLAMAPLGEKVAERLAPLLDATEQDSRALVGGIVDGVREPLRGFLRANASDREKNRFYELAMNNRAEPERAEVGKEDFTIVIPAFLVTELGEAFALGFAIFLPFLIIDLVVANVLLALGMQSLNPTQISLPFKLLLFVAADGWGLLAASLVSGYSAG